MSLALHHDSRAGERRWRWACIVVLLLGALWCGLRLSEPWGRGLEGINGGFYGLQARNLLRWDGNTTWGGGILNTGAPEAVEPAFYMHHPPLLVWSIAASYAVFGESEWSTRLPMLLALLGCVWLVMLLGRRWFGQVTAMVAGVIFLALPVCGLYGMHADVHGPLTLLMALGVVHGYQRWLDGVASAQGMFLWMLLGVLTDWPVLVLPVLLLAHTFLTGQTRALRWTLVKLGLAAGGMLLVVLAHAAWLKGGLDFLFNQLNKRTFSMTDDRAGSFTLAEWLVRQAEHLARLYTVPLLLLALAGVVQGVIWNRARMGLLLVLLGFGLADILLGLQASYVHDAWSLFLWPVVALAAAYVVMLAHGRWLDSWPLATVAALGMSVVAHTTGTDGPKAADYDASMGHSCAELGAFLRAEVPESEAVMLVGEFECPPALYWYADRTLAPFVADETSLKLALEGRGYYGPLGFPIVSQKEARTLVMPAALAEQYGPLVETLNKGWQAEVKGKFLLWRR